MHLVPHRLGSKDPWDSSFIQFSFEKRIGDVGLEAWLPWSGFFWQENPEGYKEIWESREMSYVVLMKTRFPVRFLFTRQRDSCPPVTNSSFFFQKKKEAYNRTALINTICGSIEKEEIKRKIHRFLIVFISDGRCFWNMLYLSSTSQTIHWLVWKRRSQTNRLEGQG